MSGIFGTGAVKAIFKNKDGSEKIGYISNAIGAVATTLNRRMEAEPTSIFNFMSDSEIELIQSGTDVNVDVAFAAAWSYATTLSKFAPEFSPRSLYLPAGSYLITQNNAIGKNIKNNAYGGLMDFKIFGDGRQQSILKFRPAISGGAMYDQSISGTLGLMGITFEDMGVILENTSNGGAPVHFIKSVAVGGQASQGFRFSRFKAIGTPSSIFLQLLGNAVNESELSFSETKFSVFRSIIRCENSEAVNHVLHSFDCEEMFGHVFDYVRGGCLAVYGGNVLFSSSATNEAAMLSVGTHDGSISGQSSQTFLFSGVRTELRGPLTRALYIETGEEAQITFDSCSFFANMQNNQAWAKATVQHYAKITFRNCVLPKRGAGEMGTFQLTDSTSGIHYADTNAIVSVIKFIDCNYEGDRVSDTLPYVDFSKLTVASANYRSCQIVYCGCDGIPDSVELGMVTRMGRTINSNAAPKLMFRGEEFPRGDGVNIVKSIAGFNTVVPFNNYLASIEISRPSRAIASDPYSIEFVDQAEWTTTGSGVVFGSMTAQAANAAMNIVVPINRMFSGTRAQRTIWARLKTGVTVTSPGRVEEGATMWANVF